MYNLQNYLAKPIKETLNNTKTYWLQTELETHCRYREHKWLLYSIIQWSIRNQFSTQRTVKHKVRLRLWLKPGSICYATMLTELLWCQFNTAIPAAFGAGR